MKLQDLNYTMILQNATTTVLKIFWRGINEPMPRQPWAYPQDVGTLNWSKSIKTNNSHYILKLGSNVRGSRPASA